MKRLKTPRLEIYPKRITQNTRHILDLCLKHEIGVSCVTKVTCAHQAVVSALLKGGAKVLADSRTENLVAIKKQLKGRTPNLLLTRLPTPSRAAEAVASADVSLVSSFDTIQALSKVMRGARKRHQVVVMVDLGDLREGLWPDRVPETLMKAKTLKGIEVIGLGTNLACYGGVIPSRDNLTKLVALAEQCRRSTGLELPIISGGNSSSLPLVACGEMPAGVNHLRVGEAILLGRNVIDRSPFPGTRQDTFIAIGEVIELESKPSMPIGDRGQDAFGATPQFEDRGVRRRAIINLGRQDVVPSGLKPVDRGIEVLGASSDHLILDVEDAAQELKVGSEVAFYPDYGAVLALATSPYVFKLAREDK